MPEVPELIILSQYLLTKLKDRTIEDVEILSGKYTRNKIDNIDLLKQCAIIDIDSKGKLMWFELYNKKTKDTIYLTSHLGLTGFWSFGDTQSARIKITLSNEKKNNTHDLIYEDDRNFGNIEVLLTKNELDKKTNELAHDCLKEVYDKNVFIKWTNMYLSKSKKRAEQKIGLVLMKQKQSDGIVCGIGNYLMAEILYDAKISPFRTIGSLTKNDLDTLCDSMQYITKLSYYNNKTGYMTHFDTFIELHKKRIDSGIYPNYHSQTKLKKNDEFQFKVYRQKTDPLGNAVEADKTLQKDRSTYWVKNVQK